MSSQEQTPREDHYSRGMNLYRQGRYEQALAELGQVRGQDNLIGRLGRFYEGLCHRELGLSCIRQGRFEQAAGHLRLSAATVGRQADLSSYLAAAYAGAGQYDDCVQELERSAETSGDDVAASRLAQAQWRAGRREQAHLTLLSALRKLGPGAALHLQMGLFLSVEERFAEARRHFQQAAQIDCTSVRAHFYLGLCCSALHEPLEAVRSFQRAFDLRGQDLRLALHLSLAARAAQQAGHAVVLELRETPCPQATSHVRQLARYIAGESDFVEAFLALPPSAADGDLFGLLGGLLEMALQEHPTYADLYCRLSQVYARLGRLDDARRAALAALHLNPRYVQVLVHLARLEAQDGNADQAARHAQQAIACGGDWADVHCLAGEMLAPHDPAQARRHLERALQLNHNYTRAACALSRLAA